MCCFLMCPTRHSSSEDNFRKRGTSLRKPFGRKSASLTTQVRGNPPFVVALGQSSLRVVAIGEEGKGLRRRWGTHNGQTLTGGIEVGKHARVLTGQCCKHTPFLPRHFIAAAYCASLPPPAFATLGKQCLASKYTQPLPRSQTAGTGQLISYQRQ